MRAHTLLAGLFLLSGSLTSAAEAQSVEPAVLADVDATVREDAAVVLIKTTGAPRYQAALLDNPPRLSIDFLDTDFAWRRSPLAGLADPIKEIRGSQYRKGVARLVIELTRRSDYLIEATPAGLRVALRAGRVATVPPVAAPPTAAPPAAAPPTAITQAAVPSNETEARNPGNAGIPAASAPANPTGPAKLLLYGVVLGNLGWVAYIGESSATSVAAYRVGDRIGDETIEVIEDERVVLKGPDGTTEIRLSDDKPGSQKRPPSQ
jgi:hypothetical protein